MKKKQQDWSFRLQQEQKSSKTSHFITLTYENKWLPIHETADKNGEVIYQANLVKRDLQLFMKRIRKHQQKVLENYSKLTSTKNTSTIPKIRYYAIGEYGSKLKRPHYHVLLFNTNPQTIKEIESIWGLGTVDIGEVEPKSITYVTNYVINARNQYYGTRQKPFATMSKQPGIGHDYLVHNKKWHSENKYFHALNASGTKIGLPDYYKNKIFDRRQKEDHRLKNEQLLIDKEIKQEKAEEKRGDNPYTLRLLRIETLIKKHNKKAKNQIL